MGPAKAEALQGQTGGLLGQVEQLPGAGVGVIKVLAHAHVLGALAGKDKGYVRHVHLKREIRIIFRYNSSELNCIL